MVENENVVSTEVETDTNSEAVESPTVDVENNIMESLSEKQNTSHSLPSVSSLLENGFDDLELDDASYEELAGKSITSIKEDEMVSGKIIHISKDEIQVDRGRLRFGRPPHEYHHPEMAAGPFCQGGGHDSGRVRKEMG